MLLDLENKDATVGERVKLYSGAPCCTSLKSLKAVDSLELGTLLCRRHSEVADSQLTQNYMHANYLDKIEIHRNSLR